MLEISKKGKRQAVTKSKLGPFLKALYDYETFKMALPTKPLDQQPPEGSGTSTLKRKQEQLDLTPEQKRNLNLFL